MRIPALASGGSGVIGFAATAATRSRSASPALTGITLSASWIPLAEPPTSPSTASPLASSSSTSIPSSIKSPPSSTNSRLAHTNVYIEVFETPVTFAPTAIQQTALTVVNQIKTAAGLPTANLSTGLDLAAQRHANYLANDQRTLDGRRIPSLRLHAIQPHRHRLRRSHRRHGASGRHRLREPAWHRACRAHDRDLAPNNQTNVTTSFSAESPALCRAQPIWVTL